MATKNSLIGQRFGRVLILAIAKTINYHKFVTCQCDCGNISDLRIDSLKVGHTKSCGCLLRKQKGLSGTPEYTAWKAMHYRCSTPTHPEYVNYGGRGITICNQWNSYPAFLADVGKRPSNAHSLDRINTNGNYEPENVRWGTITQQNANKRKTIVTARRLQELLDKEQLLQSYVETYGVIDA